MANGSRFLLWLESDAHSGQASPEEQKETLDAGFYADCKPAAGISANPHDKRPLISSGNRHDHLVRGG
jgi:hypothetical protein